MKDLPILKYTDLREVMYLDCHNHLNGVVVDDASLEVMLRIEKTLNRLEIMGDDDKRYLWIEIKAPSKKYRDEEVDENDNYWYVLLTGLYQEMHYMILSNEEGRFIDLRSQRFVREERKPDVFYGNVSRALKKLEKYVTALVDQICINPDEYNAYVAKNLPYRKRKGKIRRKDLNRICPTYKTFDNPERAVSIVNKMERMPIITYDKMTLRTYMHIWRILYEAYCTKNTFLDQKKEFFSGLSDIEVFKHNNKGFETEGLDLDSEKDFLKWMDENSPYHCLDVAYARISLAPIKNGVSWYVKDADIPNGKWFFSLSYSIYGYSEDVVNMLEALEEAGIGLRCDSLTRLNKMALEEDWVSLSPLPNKYKHDDELGSEISLPYIDEDISKEQVCKLIEAAEWNPLEQVRPL
ncbi:MAG: hypothetical protein MJ010_03890 [Paludibacteraceae bacterium]|nr:hypothetical protein [Paludibacteraceae bacterium]